MLGAGLAVAATSAPLALFPVARSWMAMPMLAVLPIPLVALLTAFGSVRATTRRLL